MPKIQTVMTKMQSFGCVLEIIAILLIITLRILSVHLTEGEAFYHYLPFWVLSIAFVVAGIALISKPKNCKHDFGEIERKWLENEYGSGWKFYKVCKICGKKVRA